MKEQLRDPKFYVVGGAVQPGRDCYLQRVADAELLRRLTDHEYCHVLAQPQAGKTSLAASTAMRLRGQNVGVGVVDLTQASAEDPSANAGRWYYSIVYRIARDLRLKADLQGWWAERGGLTNLQRMREFFREIVLVETDQPIVVFFDRLEAVLDEPLAQDLLKFVRACYDARATVPEFSRLSFVLLGSVAADELVPTVQGSPFEISTPIELDDFSPQELAGLMQGLGETDADAEAVVARVWSWTRGHPYLSQKVFRGLARRADAEISVSGVDDLVRTQFLTSAVTREEPHVSAVAARLLRDDNGRTARLNLYGRIRKGVEVQSDPASRPQHDLARTGIIVVGPHGEIRVRNEIYAMVFSTYWVNQNLPFGVRGIAIAAAVIALLLGLPVWYTESLPRPYIQALTAANQDYQVAEDAYSSLASFPGYRTTADALFSDYLERSSHSAAALDEVMRINGRLTALPGGQERGAQLLADFWERQAAQRMHDGDRDGALLAVFESLQPAGEHERRRRLAAELIGNDYPYMRASLHMPAPLKAVRVAADKRQLTALDTENTLRVWDMSLPEPALVLDTALVAEELLPLVQRRAFDQLPAAPHLLIQLTHPDPAQVRIRLRSPAGREALLQLTDAQSAVDGLFRFDFAAIPQLRQLLTLQRSGNWTLLVTDQQPGDTGVLQGWSISTARQNSVADELSVNQPIPEPRTSVNAATRISADGARALSWPVNPDTPGPVLIWDTVTGAILARIPRDAGMRDALFVTNGQRVLTMSAGALQLWRSADGIKAGQFSPKTRGAPRVRLAIDGRYAALPVTTDSGAEAIEIWDLQRPRRLRSLTVPGASAAGALALDAQARYLAVAAREGGIRVWDVRSGRLLREYLAGAAVSDLWFDKSGSWLAAGDAGHTLRVWSISESASPRYERRGSSPWSIAFSADGRGLLAGSPDRAYQWVWLPQGQAASLELRHFDTAVSGVQPLAPVVPAIGDMAVTSAPAGSIKVWSLPTGVPGGAVSALRSGVFAAVSPDSQRVATGADTASVRIYAPDQPASLTLASRSPDAGRVAAVAALEFSPDNERLAVGAANGTVQLWGTTGGIPQSGSALHPDGAVQDIEFNADGSIVFSASSREVLATDTRTGQTLARLGIQADRPQLAYAPESGIVFVAGDESGVTRWDWRNNEAAMIVAGTAGITRVATTPSGARIVTASRDLQLTLWDVTRRVPLATTATAAATVDALWFVDNGRQLVVQAGSWLHSVGVMPAGLSVSTTRLLSGTPAALRPSYDGQSVDVLTLAAANPRLRSVNMRQPTALPVQGDAGQLRYAWQRRLGMTLDPQGRSQPFSALAAPALQSSGGVAR